MNYCLFEVIGKYTNRTFHVFDVRIYENGYPKFLVFINNEWKYVSAKVFVPLAKDGE